MSPEPGGPAMTETRQEELRRRIAALGFDDVRFASLLDPVGGELREWLTAGMQGEMQWMERTAAKRLDPELVLPGARSVIMLGVNYWAEKKIEGRKADLNRTRIVEARFTA